jgi:hypothetical protein
MHQVFNPIKSDVASFTIVILSDKQAGIVVCTGFIHYFLLLVRQFFSRNNMNIL